MMAIAAPRKARPTYLYLIWQMAARLRMLVRYSAMMNSSGSPLDSFCSIAAPSTHAPQYSVEPPAFERGTTTSAVQTIAKQAASTNPSDKNHVVENDAG